MPPPESSTPPEPVTSLDDPRAIQILSTEHWSLLSARSLAYNEAFTRGGMFLSFLSMSFVALALLSQAMAFDQQFLIIAAIVLAFDLIIGLTTYGRIMGANADDLRAVHGMSRIRHGYTQIAPIVAPYFVTGTHDDSEGVMISYGNPPDTYPAVIWYGLTTSGGMIGLISSMVGGCLAGVMTLLFGGSGGLAIGVALAGTLIVLTLETVLTMGAIERVSSGLPVLFPSDDDHSASRTD
jgi:hypothetical protein